ncbi:MAG: EMC3/TMCO1 family protein, partial [Planctomycetota bacterium]
MMISRFFPALNTVDGWLAGLLPNTVDGWLAGLLPFVFRLMIWGALGGALSILVYARLSPQASIKKLKKKMRGLQREMLGLDLEFADFMRLSSENLKTSLRLFAAVLGPGLVSVLPVLLIAVWIHTCMAYEAPASQDDLVITAQDENVELRLITRNNQDNSPGEEIRDR